MDSSTFSRRAFNAQALGSLLVYSLLETRCCHDWFATEVRPNTDAWLADVNQLAQDLKGQKLEQVAWQKKVAELMEQVNLDELLKMIDFDRLTANVNFAERGERSMRFSFPKVEG